MNKAALLGVALGLMATLPCWAEELTLTYRDDNRWVAPQDNKPLIKLLSLAKKGNARYRVKLPNENRKLAVDRLEVLQGLLEREAKDAVVMEEIAGSAKAGTLIIITN